MKRFSARLSLNLTDRYFAFIHRRTVFDAALLHLAVILVFAAGLYFVLTVNAAFITTVPTRGGTLVEGIVGTPRFVNPVLAITRADQDMVQLVFSGLLRLNAQGELIPDIAETVTLSEDGYSYDIQLRRGVRFHNGSELTTRDVVYTIGLIQNPDLKSPLRGNWEGVQLEVVDDHRLTITLEEPYVPFIENLTVGILPRELWSELPIEQIPFSQNNTEPIGAGPYQVTNVLRTASGLISAFQLAAFENTADNSANITTLVFNFYQNEELLLAALADRKISGSPSVSNANFTQLDDAVYKVIEQPLPRSFGIFFNQNRSEALRNQAVRQALSEAIDREQLVATVLHGFGIPTTSPIPPGFLDVELDVSSRTSSTSTPSDPIAKASSTLATNGWNRNEEGAWTKEINDTTVTLSVTLATANNALFTQTAQFIEAAWTELGVEVTVSQYEQTDLIQGIIRPRDFSAVLYGADIGRSIDLYPFWHSSQQSDPGLNIAQYTNIDTDALLERIRTQADQEIRHDDIRSFERIVKSELPAIFLYTPTFGYVVDRGVSTIPQARISRPSERFATVRDWHVRSDNIWPLFTNQRLSN